MQERKILIVDDDQDIRLSLGIMLRANNYDTVFANDALAAISVACKEKPDLVLLDLNLPAGDGFMVMGKLKGFIALDSVPVIVITARNPQENRQRAVEAGAEAFFQKPIDHHKLLSTIAKVLE